MQGVLSDSISINTGAPQGCVLSTLLYILYTNDCMSGNNDIRFFKYADFTAILGMIRGDENNYRSNIEQFIKWCDDNYLQLNQSKLKEITVDFRVATQQHKPVKIKDENIEIVPKYNSNDR